MTTYKKMLHILSIVLRDLSAVILTTMIGTYFVEIARRTIIQKSITWIQEVNVILVVWLVFLGAAHVYLSSELIRVDFLHVRTKGLLRLIWTLVIHIVSLAVLYFFTTAGTKYMIHMMPTLTNVLKISYMLYALPLVISSVSMLLGLVAKVYDAVAEYRQYCDSKKGKKGVGENG